LATEGDGILPDIAGLSVSGDGYFLSENGLESPLFVEVVNKHHRRDMKVLVAGLAGRRLALHILQEAVSETILGPLAACGFHSPAAAMRTGEFEHILLGIAIQSCPTGVANSDNFFNMSIAIHRQSPSMT
jgi:hypothetical protein